MGKNFREGMGGARIKKIKWESDVSLFQLKMYFTGKEKERRVKKRYPRPYPFLIIPLCFHQKYFSHYIFFSEYAAQFVECLLSMQEALHPAIHKMGMMMHACNPST